MSQSHSLKPNYDWSPVLLAKLPKLNLPLKVSLIFVFVYFFGHQIPLPLKSIAYSLSLSLNEILIVMLPLIVFVCMYNTVLSQKGRALGFVLALFSCTTLSNFVSSLFGYGIAYAVISHKLINIARGSAAAIKLPMAWNLSLPQIIQPMWALAIAVVLGLYFVQKPNQTMNKIMIWLNQFVNYFLKKVFIPILPIFALGFIVHMQHTGVLTQMAGTYLPVILLILLANFVYSFVLFGCVTGFKWSKWLQGYKNTLPSGLMAFSTMSSLATMPLTLEAAEKNLGDSELANAIIPATVNVHLIGNSIATPILALTVLASFNHALPDLHHYLIFSLYFVINKFAIAAVPGGSIIIMMPILSKYLGVHTEMARLMATLYLVVDPLITAGNVLGNGGFVIFFAKLMLKFKKKHIR